MSIAGVEDYAAWLNLCDFGARFLVLPEPLVTYEDATENRFSRAIARQEVKVAAVRWRSWLRRPHDGAALRSSLRGTADAVRWKVRARRGQGIQNR
jgi:hypothetical protein